MRGSTQLRLRFYEVRKMDNDRRDVYRAKDATILFVDDQEQLLDIGKSLLELLGYEVLTATNGAEAEAVLELCGDGVDLVVTDLAMPKRGGRDLLKTVLQYRPYIPVIAVSGNMETQTVTELIDEGFFAFLGKPFRISELSLMVKAALEEGTTMVERYYEGVTSVDREPPSVH
jgi:DNA-binding NtrC family response regulator